MTKQAAHLRDRLSRSFSLATGYTRRAYQVQWHLLQDTPPFFDLAGENVVCFLAGSGRSGTTWVQEMINYNDDFRILF